MWVIHSPFALADCSIFILSVFWTLLISSAVLGQNIQNVSEVWVDLYFKDIQTKYIKHSIFLAKEYLIMLTLKYLCLNQEFRTLCFRYCNVFWKKGDSQLV